MDYLKEKVYFIIIMEIDMKENLKMINLTAKVFIILRVEIDMKVI
jgi:hypothetical protein